MNPSTRRTGWAAPLALVFFAVLWAARWASFPLVLDPYYHLFIARQIVEAGGPLAYEWWEYAPVGRPHLYPPVFHLLLALLLKTGLEPIVSLQLATAVLPPALLATLFVVVRRLQDEAAAQAAALVAVMPFAFHLQLGITLASSLGLILLLWACDAIERKRPLAAGLLLAILFYTHLGLPWMALLGIAAAAAIRMDLRKTALTAAGWGVLLALPWLWHLWQNRGAFASFPRYENRLVEGLPFLWVLALAGAWVCLKRQGCGRWPLALLLGFSPLLAQHRYRWISGEGMVALIWLAAIGLQYLAGKLAGYVKGQAVARGLLAALLVCAPAISWEGDVWRWQGFDSAPWHLTGSPLAPAKITESSFYNDRTAEVVAAVVRHSEPLEILWSNASYALGAVAALANRPMASAMLTEVRPANSSDPVAAAAVVVWFKLDAADGFADQRVLRRKAFSRVAETEMAAIFRAVEPPPIARRPQSAMPLAPASAVLAAVFCLIAWAARKPV